MYLNSVLNPSTRDFRNTSNKQFKPQQAFALFCEISEDKRIRNQKIYTQQVANKAFKKDFYLLEGTLEKF